MSESEKAFKSQKSYKGSEMQAFCTGYEMAADKYKTEIEVPQDYVGQIQELLTDYVKLEAERDALKLKLIETAKELYDMIEMANARLEQDICATDETPPDYFDAQTVHEAMMLVNKLEGQG